MKMVFNKVVKAAVLSSIGYAGYLAGRYHEKANLNTDKKYDDMPGIPVFFPHVQAASLATENNLAQFRENLPALTDGKSDIANKESELIPVAKRVTQIMKFGFPSLDNIRSLDDYVLSYDRRNRVANWVFEHLTKESVRPNDKVDRSKCEFHEDVSIHPYFRSKNSDYKGSGFDRGHLAAAGNHKNHQKHCEQTFLLSNMAPQVGEGFNRHSWNRLEKYVRKLTKNYPNVYVCTGPLYLPRKENDGKTYIKYQVIGASTVAVPTHFFKVIAMETPDLNYELEAYVMPNAPISDETPLTVFQVPPDSIERAAGLLLFDRLPRDKIKRINSRTGNSSWPLAKL